MDRATLISIRLTRNTQIYLMDSTTLISIRLTRNTDLFDGQGYTDKHYTN